MFLFFNDTATTEIYTLSLHDALPIYAPGKHGRSARSPRGLLYAVAPPQEGLHGRRHGLGVDVLGAADEFRVGEFRVLLDRKSTRLNSSHANISYAVFCLTKKKPTYHA